MTLKERQTEFAIKIRESVSAKKVTAGSVATFVSQNITVIPIVNLAIAAPLVPPQPLAILPENVRVCIISPEKLANNAAPVTTNILSV